MTLDYECRHRAPDLADGPKLRGPDDVVALLSGFECDRRVDPNEFIVGIDASHLLAGIACRRRSTRCPVIPSELRQIATTFSADAVVLVSKAHADELAIRTLDIEEFLLLDIACDRAGVLLLDHLLVSDRRWRSLRECAGASRASGDA